MAFCRSSNARQHQQGPAREPETSCHSSSKRRKRRASQMPRPQAIDTVTAEQQQVWSGGQQACSGTLSKHQILQRLETRATRPRSQLPIPPSPAHLREQYAGGRVRLASVRTNNLRTPGPGHPLTLESVKASGT